MTIAIEGAPYPPVTGREPCTTVDPDLFFPPGPGRSPEVKRAQEEMCGRCHVRQQCLAYALTHDVKGIWGGATEAERESMRRKNQISVVPMAPPADVGLMVRASRRGTPVAVIASLAGMSAESVARALRDHRAQAAAGDAAREVAR
jgi:WhiB family redox-sensing transcriptional regulator